MFRITTLALLGLALLAGSYSLPHKPAESADLKLVSEHTVAQDASGYHHYGRYGYYRYGGRYGHYRYGHYGHYRYGRYGIEAN